MSIRIDGTNTTDNPGITGSDADTGLQLGTNEVSVVTGGTARFTVESDGDVTVEAGDCNLTDGNLVVAAGHGIDFSADANAAGMSSELLDDYEEGTFTPNLTFATPGTSSFEYSLQTGFYTKVGRLVHYRMELRLSSFSKGTGTGDLRVEGFPFTTADLGNGQFIGTIATFNAPLSTVDGEYPVFNARLNVSNGSFKIVRPNNSWNIMNDPDSNSQYKIDVTVFTT